MWKQAGCIEAITLRNVQAQPTKVDHFQFSFLLYDRVTIIPHFVRCFEKFSRSPNAFFMFLMTKLVYSHVDVVAMTCSMYFSRFPSLYPYLKSFAIAS